MASALEFKDFNLPIQLECLDCNMSELVIYRLGDS